MRDLLQSEATFGQDFHRPLLGFPSNHYSTIVPYSSTTASKVCDDPNQAARQEIFNLEFVGIISAQTLQHSKPTFDSTGISK
jgi:hypothetical protein